MIKTPEFKITIVADYAEKATIIHVCSYQVDQGCLILETVLGDRDYIPLSRLKTFEVHRMTLDEANAWTERQAAEMLKEVK
jgi:hypothetical protein